MLLTFFIPPNSANEAWRKVEEAELRTQRLLERVEPLSMLGETLSRNLSDIRDLINQARRQAASVHTHCHTHTKHSHAGGSAELVTSLDQGGSGGRAALRSILPTSKRLEQLEQCQFDSEDQQEKQPASLPGQQHNGNTTVTQTHKLLSP